MPTTMTGGSYVRDSRIPVTYADRKSRLVFIVNGLAREIVLKAFAMFCAASPGAEVAH